ncbi:MAG: sulfotransferase [Bacteroidetes bacterium]|nr:sulfotransferase [Bacteroidota bacterium]
MKETIAIFGVPRSGTSWLGQIFNSHPAVAYRFQPLFSYAFKGRIKRDSSPEEIQMFYQELLKTDDPFVLQKTNISGQKTRSFAKENPSHLVWKEVRYLHLIEKLLQETNTKIIGILRHPCAVINSWIKAPKEFDPSWSVKEEWRLAPKKNQGKEEAFYGFEKWKETASDFLRFRESFPRQFKLVIYEELHQNPIDITEDLFDFSNLSFSDQTNSFLQKSSNTPSNDPYSVMRKNHKADSWKEELDGEIQQTILEDAFLRSIDLF